MKLYTFQGIEDQLASIQTRDFERQSSYFLGRGDITDWSSVVAAMHAPWTKGLDAVESFAAELPELEVKDRRRRLRFDEDNGDEVDNDRLRSGQSYWRVSKRISQAGLGEVVIIVEIGALGYWTADEMLWRGAAAVALTQRLEDYGHRVELWGSTAGNRRFIRGDDRTLTMTCLKRFEDTADISTLVNVTSGWFYRTAGFATYAAIGRQEARPHSSGYGASSAMTTEELAQLRCDVYIRQVFSKQEAVKLLKEFEHASKVAG